MSNYISYILMNDNESNDKKINIKSNNMKNYFNGAISGSFGVFVSHPFDTVKTSIQNKTIMPHSLTGLYRGIYPAMYGVGFEKAIVFGTYTSIYKYLITTDINTNLLNPISGAVAGLTASLVVTPTERIKILLQSNKNISMSSVTPYNLYRGLTATFSREIPGFSVYFTVYNKLKDNYSSKYMNFPLYISFLYGGFAGTCSWMCIYPQDVIKTRMQTNTSNNISIFQTTKNIYREGGISVFYKGIHFALLRAIPLHAGTFMMMELLTKYN